MANVNSLTVGNTTLPVANSLASLSDTNIPANPAAGSLLTLQNGKWTPNTVEGAIGGKPALVNKNNTQGVLFGYDASTGPQYQTVDASGNTHAVNFTFPKGILYYKMQAGSTEFQLEDIISPPAHSYLTGLDTSQTGAITAADTVLSALGKLGAMLVPPVSAVRFGFNPDYDEGRGAVVISITGSTAVFDVYISYSGINIARFDVSSGAVTWASIPAQH